MSIEDLQTAEQHMAYVVQCLQSAEESIQSAIAYTQAHGGTVGPVISEGLRDVQHAMHGAQDQHSQLHAQLQAAIQAEMENPEVPPNPYDEDSSGGAGDYPDSSGGAENESAELEGSEEGADV